MKVLVADDHGSILKIVSKFISKWGYTVIQSKNGLDALNVLTGENPPRIAILDWNMPGMTGVEVCKMLKDRNKGPFIYCIILTARKNEGDLIEALNLGAHDFQNKPINAGELRSRLTVGGRLVEANDKIDRYAQSMEVMAKVKAHQLVKMEKKVRTDQLTKALSRSYFTETSAIEFDRCQKDGESMAIIMFDLNEFKLINDNHGHKMGDDALQIVSKICKTQFRECDLFARYGGDEFIALIPDVGAELAIQIGKRVCRAVASCNLKGIELSLSWGIAMNREKDTEVDEMIARADLMMYKMKKVYHESKKIQKEKDESESES